jgi:hypothetical protein
MQAIAIKKAVNRWFDDHVLVVDLYVKDIAKAVEGFPVTVYEESMIKAVVVLDGTDVSLTFEYV